jgi:hypothetical protein
VPNPADRTGVSTQRNSSSKIDPRPRATLFHRLAMIENGRSSLAAIKLPKLLAAIAVD